MSLLLIAAFPEFILNFRGALIDTLLARGQVVHVAAPRLPFGGKIRVALEARGVVVHDVPLERTGTNPATDLVFCWFLFRLIRRIAPSVVLSYTIKPVIYGSLAAWMAGVPRRFALVTGLGYAFTGDRKGVLAVLIRRLYRLALNRVDKVFFQNPDDEVLFRHLGVLCPRTPSVVVNGSGVDIQAFSVAPLPPGPLRFLMIARLLGDKGVREYVQAARRVRAMQSDVQFGLVGWIDDNPDAIAKSDLEEWTNEGCIEFLGRLADVRPAIANCSVYVLPSYREGTPRSVLEAMAMGRPIVTTDAPGCRETVIDGENGFLVPVRSVDGLVAGLLHFVECPQLVAQMGRRSRQIAVEKYDVHKVNEVMLREMGISEFQVSGAATG